MVLREYPLLQPRPGWQVQDPALGAFADLVRGQAGAGRPAHPDMPALSAPAHGRILDHERGVTVGMRVIELDTGDTLQAANDADPIKAVRGYCEQRGEAFSDVDAAGLVRAYDASGERFATLTEAGVSVQRPLWASTGVRDPAYADTLYVDGLAGPDTVNTMPMATLQAAADPAEITGATVEIDPEPDLRALAALRDLDARIRRLL